MRMQIAWRHGSFAFSHNWSNIVITPPATPLSCRVSLNGMIHSPVFMNATKQIVKLKNMSEKEYHIQKRGDSLIPFIHGEKKTQWCLRTDSETHSAGGTTHCLNQYCWRYLRPCSVNRPQWVNTASPGLVSIRYTAAIWGLDICLFRINPRLCYLAHVRRYRLGVGIWLMPNPLKTLIYFTITLSVLQMITQ